MTMRSYGWKPDKLDDRDMPHQERLARLLKNVERPRKTNNRALMPPVYDQGALGSCTGNAISGAIQFARSKQGLQNFVPSRLFIYYNERTIEGTVMSDAGAEIRDGIKSVCRWGACSEDDWPYDVSKFTDEPPVSCFTDAKMDLVDKYARVTQTLDLMCSCLAVGFPFVNGFSVYESFESQAVAETGIVSMPKASEEILGGHAVLTVDYDDDAKIFIVRNSWGPNWGQAGYFSVPYDYWLDPDLASDFWQIDIMT